MLDISWLLQDARQPSSHRRAGTGTSSHRSVAAGLSRSIAGGVDVFDLRARKTEWADGAAPGQELPALPDSSDCQQVGHPGSPRHLSGDATDDGNGPAALRHAQRRSRCLAPREHQDDRRRVHAQTIESSVLDAMNARTKEILSAWKPSLLANGNEMKDGKEGSLREEGSSRGVE